MDSIYDSVLHILNKQDIFIHMSPQNNKLRFQTSVFYSIFFITFVPFGPLRLKHANDKHMSIVQNEGLSRVVCYDSPESYLIYCLLTRSSVLEGQSRVGD